MRSTARLLAITTILVPLLATTVRADTAGTPGTALALVHNDDGSNDYGAVNGTLVVSEPGNVLRDYSWGGSLCLGDRNLDIDQQRVLLDAIRSRMLILPYFLIGNGNTRCLTSFVLVGKKSAAADVAK
jgi:hypothetical protein